MPDLESINIQGKWVVNPLLPISVQQNTRSEPQARRACQVLEASKAGRDLHQGPKHRLPETNMEVDNLLLVGGHCQLP